MKTFEEWAAQKRPRKRDRAERLRYDAHVAAAQVLQGWPQGQSVTEADFDAALETAGAHTLGYHPEVAGVAAE